MVAGTAVSAALAADIQMDGFMVADARIFSVLWGLASMKQPMEVKAGALLEAWVLVEEVLDVVDVLKLDDVIEDGENFDDEEILKEEEVVTCVKEVDTTIDENKIVDDITEDDETTT